MSEEKLTTQEIKKTAGELTKRLGMLLKENSKFTEEDFDNFIQGSPVYFDENRLWWAWKKEEKSWRLADDETIINLFGDFFQLELSERVKLSGWISKALKLKSRKNKPLELPEYCIQFKNKIYDLVKKQEFLATPKYFLTSPINYELSESDETPVIDSLFIQWAGDEHKETLYEILAYSCLREQFLQTVIALTGAGSNGKGTYQNLIRRFLGEKNCVASNFKSLIGRSFESSALYKKLLCVIGEVDARDLTNTNLIKQFTGEDLIRYEFKGKTPFSETSPTTFLVSTNSLPMTPDKSDGFYRRWLIVDFPNQFTLKRDLLAKIPEQEYHNLTRKVVNILLKLMVQQEFSNAGTIEQRRIRYEQRSNPLMMFISEFYDEDGVSFIPIREFTNDYNNFLKDKKLRVVNTNHIGKILRDEGYEVSPRKYGEGGEKYSAKCVLGIKKIKNELEKNGSLGSNENNPSEKNGSSGSREGEVTTQTTEKLQVEFQKI